MQLTGSKEQVQALNSSVSLIARTALVVFCLAAGFAYRFLVGLFPASLTQAGVLLALAGLFILAAILARRSQSLRPYWEIPFAFFVFTLAGIAGDQSGFIQQGFVRNVLRETPSANNPLATSVLGTMLAQVVSTASLVIPIVLLTLASGRDLKSIFLDKARKRWPLLVGLVGLVVIFLYTATGRAERFFPNNGVSTARFFELAPAMLVLVLCNGLREEIWFRGLFLKKYGAFLSPWSANLLSAVIFTAFHVQITYTPALLPFLGITLISGLFFGYLMQKSESLLPSVLFHAGSDIPIFLVYLSYARP